MSKPFCKDSKELDGSVFHCLLQGNNDDNDNDILILVMGMIVMLMMIVVMIVDRYDES